MGNKKTTIRYGFLLVVIGVIMVILTSSIFTILPSSPLQNSLSAFATFPGENGKIAFVSQRDGNPEIYVMKADGSEQTNISNNPASESHPSWAPDGTKIAFGSNRDGTEHIYVMNPDGSEQTRLGPNEPWFDFYPDWSPDGTKIAFASDRDGNLETYVMDADGSNPTRKSTTHPANEFITSWSPDGTKIAFDSNRDDYSDPVKGWDVYVMDADDGSDVTRLTNNPVNDDQPDWGSVIDTETGDTTPPVITVPEDITEEATSADGAEVSFEVSAEDDVDGTVDVNCDYDSGDTFPIGETLVTCNAVDAAGNRAEESFTITVQDTTDPDVEITQSVDRRRNTEIPNGGITPISYIRITFEATDAVGIDETECSIDVGAFTSCTSPVVYDRLSRGTHEVIIRATDEAGNTREDHFTWTVGSPPSLTAPGRQ